LFSLEVPFSSHCFTDPRLRAAAKHLEMPGTIRDDIEPDSDAADVSRSSFDSGVVAATSAVRKDAHSDQGPIKQRLITVNGMTLSLEFEEEHEPPPVRDSSSADHKVIRFKLQKRDFVSVEGAGRLKNDAQAQAQPADATLQHVGGAKVCPITLRDSADEEEDDSTDSDEDEEMGCPDADLPRARRTGQIQTQHPRERDWDSVTARLRYAGRDAFYSMSGDEFMEIVGCSKGRFLSTKPGIVVTCQRQQPHFRQILRTLWEFRVNTGRMIHERNQMLGRKPINRHRLFWRIANHSLAHRPEPSPLRQQWIASDFDRSLV